jgi:hypothetical protein
MKQIYIITALLTLLTLLVSCSNSSESLKVPLNGEVTPQTPAAETEAQKCERITKFNIEESLRQIEEIGTPTTSAQGYFVNGILKDISDNAIKLADCKNK